MIVTHTCRAFGTLHARCRADLGLTSQANACRAFGTREHCIRGLNAGDSTLGTRGALQHLINYLPITIRIGSGATHPMSTHHGILVHVVFSTKYRKPHLAADWRDELFAYIGGIVQDHKSTLLKAGGIEDHVHLLLRIHPEYAISKTIQILKANSSKWINEQRKVRGRFHWQAGYGAFSVSQSSADRVKQYIANQVEHHRKQTFEAEYLRILDKHLVQYDRKYVFESEIVS